MDAHVAKPIDPVELFAALTQVLADVSIEDAGEAEALSSTA